MDVADQKSPSSGSTFPDTVVKLVAPVVPTSWLPEEGRRARRPRQVAVQRRAPRRTHRLAATPPPWSGCGGARQTNCVERGEQTHSLPFCRFVSTAGLQCTVVLPEYGVCE